MLYIYTTWCPCHATDHHKYKQCKWRHNNEEHFFFVVLVVFLLWRSSCFKKNGRNRCRCPWHISFWYSLWTYWCGCTFDGKSILFFASITNIFEFRIKSVDDLSHITRRMAFLSQLIVVTRVPVNLL